MRKHPVSIALSKDIL